MVELIVTSETYSKRKGDRQITWNRQSNAIRKMPRWRPLTKTNKAVTIW